MSRDPVPGPDLEDEDEDSGPPSGSLGTTRPGVVAGALLVALLLGRLVKPLADQAGNIPPRVGWLPVLGLFFLSAILLTVAWSTQRALHAHRPHARRPQRPARDGSGAVLEPHQAVNRLVLAKSCALAGALAAGGYLGYAISWLGVDAELGQERLLHSALAALGGLAVVAGALLLERACRVKEPPSSDLP